MTMGKKTLLAIALLICLCLSSLSAQSLAEAARKEKERRAKLEKKAAKVVTNQDLEKAKRMPSVSVPEGQIADTEEPAPEPVTEAPPSMKKTLSSQEIDREESSAVKSLEQEYEKAKEYVELLTIKMNGLWQKYYSADDATPKERIQSEISQTYLQLQKAQIDAERAQKQWEASQSKGRN